MAGKKKRPSPKTRPNRNALCPCGSGRAFKNCCADRRPAPVDKPESVPNQLKRLTVALIVLALVVGGVVLAMVRPWETTVERRPMEYDAENNRYWSEEHGHWHDGQPPGTFQPRPTTPVTEPQPWEYDAARNQYWHPTHGHWHDGRPPPPEERF